MSNLIDRIKEKRAAGVSKVRVVGVVTVPKRTIKHVIEFYLIEREGYANPFTKAGKPAAWLRDELLQIEAESNEVDVTELEN